MKVNNAKYLCKEILKASVFKVVQMFHKSYLMGSVSLCAVVYIA